MSLELTVHCDGCDKRGVRAIPSSYAYILRKNLRKFGWHHVKGRDLCPACWRERKK